MMGSIRSQRTSLVTLFKLRCAVTRVKMHVDDILDGSGVIVVPDDDPKVVYSGWGEEAAISAVFKPLQSPLRLT